MQTVKPAGRMALGAIVVQTVIASEMMAWGDTGFALTTPIKAVEPEAMDLVESGQLVTDQFCREA